MTELQLSDNLPKGEHVFPLDIDQLPAGVYTLDVKLNSITTSKKIIVID